MVEIDIKKIVALSTLRQLGVIITSIGSGIFNLAFFHLLSHAFFKALIFMSIGRIIHIVNDYQDLHKASMAPHHSSASLAFLVRANASLCGLPFLRGFYSKDLCIERTVFSQKLI